MKICVNILTLLYGDTLKLSKFYCNAQDGESSECENASGKQTQDNRNTSKLKEFF